MEQKRGFFPLFLDIRGSKVVFIGGGKIASRRIGVMSSFDCEIEVISPSVTEEIQKLVDAGAVAWRCERYKESVLEGADIVLACTNSPELNSEIIAACRARKILANNCSDHSQCDFYFPGVVLKDEVTVAVNAGGSAHKKAAKLRREIAELLEKGSENEE